MATDTRTPSEIERDIERERAELTDTLDTLQDKFSIDTIVRQIGDQFRENGGDIGRSISQSVKDNPMALALTGVGLAWMIFGGRNDEPSYRSSERYRTDRDGYRGGNAFNFENDNYGQSADSWSEKGRPSWARRGGNTSQESFDTIQSDVDSGPRASAAIRDVASTAKDRIQQAADEISDKAAQTSSALKSRAKRSASSVADARDGLADQASNLSNKLADAGATVRSGVDGAQYAASDIYQSLADGTESFTEEARLRVIRARQRAITAQQEASRAISRGGETVTDWYSQQPIIFGAIALAAGAALGGGLPRTRMENDTFGRKSDELFAEAEQIFREETEKAKSVVQAAASEVQTIADEKRDALTGPVAEKQAKSAAKSAADEVKSAAKRVSKTAKSEAKSQKLGKLEK